ncbi:MAG: hypothetical protein ACK5KR_04925 [Breznakia sp.]
MRDYITKKNFRLCSGVIGIILTFMGFYVWRVKNSELLGFDGLEKIVSLGHFLTFVFILLFIMFAIAGYMLFVFMKQGTMEKSKTEYIVGGSIYTILTVLMLYVFPLINALKNPMRVLGLDVEEFELSIKLVSFMVVVAIIYGVYQSYVLITENKGKSFVEKIKPNKCNEAETSKTPVQKVTDNAKKLLATKKGKIITAVVAVAILVTGCIGVYLANKKTDFNPFDYVAVSFEGYDGEGSVITDKKYFELGLEGVESEFFDYVEYSVKADDELSNGDKVVIIARYDEEKASKLKINVTEVKKSFTVKGLAPTIHEYDDLTKKQKQQLDRAYKTYTKDSLDLDLQDYVEVQYDFNKGFVINKKEVISKYYVDGDYEEEDDNIYYLMKIEVSGNKKSYFSDEKEPLTKTYYVAIAFEEINIESLEDYDDYNIFVAQYESVGEADDDIKAKREFVKGSSYGNDREEFE